MEPDAGRKLGLAPQLMFERSDDLWSPLVGLQGGGGGSGVGVVLEPASFAPLDS